jgi:FlaA1/EpsC-like NDP-sugar epimerase
MMKNDVLRKALTFSADSLSIIAGGILSALIYHPEASLSDQYSGLQAIIPMVLILMALISTVMKAYRDPISDHIARSMLMSVGAYVISLVMAVVFLLLIRRQQPNIGTLINLGINSAFFLCTYRLAFLARFRSGGTAVTRRVTTFNGKQNIGEARIDELLGREAMKPAALSDSSYLADRTVLVAGGAGAVGFELCSQILRLGAKHVVILDLNENKLLETETALCLKYSKARFTACIGSIQDRARLREVFDLYRPQVVFHAASYKHVSMLEKNPQEALKNNVMGTLYMVEMAIKHRTDRFILLSDDMALNPTNIIGASKRVAEMLIQRADEWGDTRFSAVRFGSAVCSSGNIIQLFKKQIESGGPVYVPDKCVEKYLMTTSEAARLILEAGGLSSGGEIFALGAGTPVNLYELAREMIQSCGLRPGKRIKIELTGAPPSEAGKHVNKPKEMDAAKTSNEMIVVLKENESPPVTFEAEFDTLCQSIDSRDYGSAISKIGVLVPTFRAVRT